MDAQAVNSSSTSVAETAVYKGKGRVSTAAFSCAAKQASTVTKSGRVTVAFLADLHPKALCTNTTLDTVPADCAQVVLVQSAHIHTYYVT